jgi:hypothetical protein
MENGEHLNLEQIQAFPTGNEEIGFKASNRKELYEWTQQALCARSYGSLHRSGKGPMKRYIGKVTGLNRAQVTRLIGQYAECGIVRTRHFTQTLALCPANNRAAFPVYATSVAFVFSRKNATEVACTSRMNMVQLFPGHNTS